MAVSYKGNIVTKESVLMDSFVAVENGILTYIGKDCPKNTEIEDYSGKLFFPGL